MDINLLDSRIFLVQYKIVLAVYSLITSPVLNFLCLEQNTVYHHLLLDKVYSDQSMYQQFL
ncbi:hypothetical protein AHTJS_05855 [Acinetobacter haemolyticus]|nr:hypothetical protein AHTJS_05855 [Acinetobacter haemolyticus]